jgi:signal transduction histidine kinase
VRALERIRGRERAARAQVEAANAKLIEADRLKDEFVALISHDLRTPLTSIMGFLELTRDERSGALSEEQRSYLEIVSRNSERLLHLVDDLLFAARLQSGALELSIDELDLAAMAEHTLEEARPRADAKQIALVAELEVVPPVLGDRRRIAQLLDNLVSNALKFTPDGGTVTVVVGSTRGRVVVEVRDTGIGIQPEETERLFDRFFRASTAVDRQISGSGLGLYIARAIVEAHNGTIGARSAVGSGTTLRVELPVFVAAEARGPVAQRQAGGT